MRRPLAALALVLIVATRAGAATPGPPVVSESFTLLPCTSAGTTLALEGCAEHRLVALDRQINALSARVYAGLAMGAPRRAFVAAASRWVAQRRRTCLRASGTSGTLAPVLFADCEVTGDRARVAYLRRRLQ